MNIGKWLRNILLGLVIVAFVMIFGQPGGGGGSGSGAVAEVAGETIPRDVLMSESSYRSALDHWAAQLAKLEARAESVMGRRVATLPVNRRGPVGTDWSREAGQELRRAVPSVAGWGGLALLVGIAVLLSWRR